MKQQKLRSLFTTLSLFLMVALFISMQPQQDVAKAAETTMTGRSSYGLHLSTSKKSAIMQVWPMKTQRESNDSVKKRRHYAPRNATKPTRKRTRVLDSNSLNKYYKSQEWKALRNEYISQHMLCEECLEHDIVTPATDVHHIVPFSTGSTDEERWQLLLNWTNLRSLCKKCHIRAHDLSKQHLAMNLGS